MSDKTAAGLEAIIRKVLGGRVDRQAVYPCRVVQQNADGSVDLVADNDRIGTFQRVPIKWGIPGVTATVPASSRCYLTWAEGDATKPQVVGWEAGTVLGIILAGGTKGVARTDDLVASDSTMATWVTAVNTLLNGTGPASKGPLTAPSDFGKISGGSSKVKAG